MTDIKSMTMEEITPDGTARLPGRSGLYLAAPGRPPLKR